MTGELKGFESAPEELSSERLRADQVASIFSLASLIAEYNDGVDPRNPAYFWLDRLMLDLDGIEDGRIRILSDPEKSNNDASNWIPTSLLASGQVLMYADGENIVQGYAGIKRDLSESGAERLIDYMQARLEIFGAFDEATESKHASAIGAAALEEVVA